MEKEPVIRLEKVEVFQGNNLVISSVSLQISKGEFVYLIGKTGSGKSSLMKILYGELPLKAGSGWVAGYSLNNLKNKEVPFLRRKLGIVFQDFQLLSDRSVNGNLKFVMKATGWKDEEQIKKRIADVLAKVGLTGKGEKKPFELSGGEQQRVSIARALINNPEIILADEPTGNLDPDTSAEIMALMQDIAKAGSAVLFATHDYLLYQKFPARTLKCENGKVTDSALPVV
jgi:cell division transport system ATP-binding protein